MQYDIHLFIYAYIYICIVGFTIYPPIYIYIYICMYIPFIEINPDKEMKWPQGKPTTIWLSNEQPTQQAKKAMLGVQFDFDTYI